MSGRREAEVEELATDKHNVYCFDCGREGPHRNVNTTTNTFVVTDASGGAFDVDPSTGKHRGDQHEIYRAKIGVIDDLSSIKWQAVTKNSPVRNIRPAILRDGDRRIILWLRGVFREYTDYQLDVVGIVEPTN